MYFYGLSSDTQNEIKSTFNVLGILPQKPIDVVGNILNSVDRLDRLGQSQLASLNVAIATADNQIDCKPLDYECRRQLAYKAIAEYRN